MHYATEILILTKKIRNSYIGKRNTCYKPREEEVDPCKCKSLTTWRIHKKVVRFTNYYIPSTFNRLL